MNSGEFFGEVTNRVMRDHHARNAVHEIHRKRQKKNRESESRLLAHRAPLVRAHAAWALGRLGAREILAAHADDDPGVVDEIALALV